MPLKTQTSAFVGRTDELSALAASFGSAASGMATTLLIEGEGGIGKTTLIERFLASLSDARVRRASGDEAEANVRFAIADQLLRAAGSHDTGTLAATQHVDVGMSLLEQLIPGADDPPTIVVIDDAHLADPDSLRALLFCLRRASASPVLVIAAVRGAAEETLPEGWLKLAAGPTGDRLRPAPLSASDIRSLADGLGVPLTNETASRLREHTGGNPLHARAVLTELPVAMGLDDARVLPAPRSYAQIVEQQVARCDADATRLVFATAVLGDRAPLDLASALSGLDEPIHALDHAIAVGLITNFDAGDRTWLEFRHPLTRAAVYAAIPHAERSRLHNAAAELVDSSESALHHRADGALLPDPVLQRELEAAAHEEIAGGGWSAAVKHLLGASRVAASRSDRERLALEAIEALMYSGDGGAARRLANRIDVAPGPHRDSVSAYLAIFAGDLPTADRLLTTAWERCDDTTAAHVAATIAQRRAFLASARLRGDESIQWARRAVDLLPGDAATERFAAPSLALGLSYTGRMDEARRALDRLLGEPGSAAGRGFILRTQKAKMQLAAGELDAARTAFDQSAEASLAEGLFVVAAMSLSGLTRADYLAGRWDDAAVSAERAVTLAVESEDRWVIADARAAASLVPLARGDWGVAEKLHAAIAAETATFERHIAVQVLATARLAAAQERHEDVLDALARLDRLEEADGRNDPTFHPWQHLKAEALVKTGRLDEARAFIDATATMAAARANPLMTARMLHAEGQLVVAAQGGAADAEAAFSAAREIHERLRLPFEQSLVELSHARLLRRDGKRRAAAALLVAARERLAGLSALPTLTLCDQELTGCGLSPVARSERDFGWLTPQETAVARLVVSGLTNREVATQLMLSTKTVEFHLSNVYLKLSVHSRSELRALVRANAIDL